MAGFPVSFFIDGVAGARAARDLWLVHPGGLAALARGAGRRRRARGSTPTGFKAERHQVALIACTRWLDHGAQCSASAHSRPSTTRPLAHGRAAGPLAWQRRPAWRIATPRTREAAATTAGAGLGIRLLSVRRVQAVAHAAPLERARVVAPTARTSTHVERTVRRDRDGARFHQYARLRHDAGATRGRSVGTGARSTAPSRARSSWATNCSADYPAIHAVGQAATLRAAARRLRLGRSRASEGDDRRQGRLLRLRRARHQAVRRHVADEKRHGRSRLRAGARATRHGVAAAGAPARADPGGRERDRRQRVSAGRRDPHAQGHHRRGRQHRRRGPAGAVRCDRGGRRRAAGPA